MKQLKHATALLLALLLAFGTAAAVLAEAQTIAPWVDYAIIGSVKEDTPADPTDNFFLYANKDWLLNTPVNESRGMSNAFIERDIEVTEEILALLEGEKLAGIEGQLVQTLYETYMNMDKRNELGIAPLMPYVERIQAIDSMEALNAYLLQDDRIETGFATFQVLVDMRNSAANAVYLDSGTFLLSDADEYRSMTGVGKRMKEALTGTLNAMLARVGYDEASAQAVIDLAFEFDTELGKAAMGSSAQYSPDYYTRIYNVRTVEELKAESPSYPLVATLQSYTDAGVDRFILCDVEWLEKLNELYTEENLEALKAFLLVRTLLYSTTLIDQEGMDIQQAEDSVNAGTTIKYDMRETAYKFCNSMLGMAVARIYTDAYVSDKMRQDVTDIINDVTAVYRVRLQNAEWLGEDTREKAIEKLDKLYVRVAAPTDWSLYDYSSLELPSYEQGGSLIGNFIAIKRYYREQAIADALRPVNPEKWPDVITPQTVNAYYDPTGNSINILAGILGGFIYDEEFSYEKKLSAVGMVIGHEITHAFDYMGSQFDAYGNMSNWWTEADKAAFDERTKKVADYYGSVEVFPGLCQNGQLTLGEAVADLGALSCMLEMAKEKPDFDYKEFFTGFANVWTIKLTRESEEVRVKDSHPVCFLRTNCAVQQFEEFYTAFDVKEGDNMYLAPEKRLKVW